MLINELAIPQDVDYVAVSFVRTADEINEVRKLLGDSGIRIIAKIETPHALENLEEIVLASDAVMVARGDLGTECPFELVPVFQKRIIRTCLANAVPVITATQMMESMITASTPTRAEASDIANAVCDGTDAIMLSGETAIGHNPPLVVQAMAKIADAAEVVADFDRFALTLSPDRRLSETTVALTHGAWWAMNDLGVKAVLCCTRSGATAQAMSALRPEAKLIALSTSPQTVRQEALTWGVDSLVLPETTDSDSMVAAAADRAKEAGLVESGDLVGILSGSRDVPGATNDFRLITIH
jgi:pyruvate kinase